MARALIVGLTWLALTAAVSLVVGRVMLRADARQERAARAERRARARWVVGPASGADMATPLTQGTPGRPDEAVPRRDPRGSCALARPSRHGHPPTPRRPRGRGSP